MATSCSSLVNAVPTSPTGHFEMVMLYPPTLRQFSRFLPHVEVRLKTLLCFVTAPAKMIELRFQLNLNLDEFRCGCCTIHRNFHLSRYSGRTCKILRSHNEQTC